MPDHKFRLKGFLVWIICALFFLYEFLLRTIIGTYQASLMKDLHLSALQFSLMSSTIFFIVYGAMQLPVGILVDRIGLKKALLIGAGGCIIASLGFSYAQSYALALFFRMLMGFGASFGFICLLISVTDWMPHKYSAIFIGLSQFIGTMGPILGAGPLETLSLSRGISWRSVFLGLSVVGFILFILVLLFVENNKEQSGRFTLLYRPEKILTSIKRLFTQPQPWLVGIVCAGLYFTIEYLSENEGRAFLMLKGLPSTSASYMLTISWIGYAFGCPFLGFLSDFFECRKKIMTLSAILGLIVMGVILYVPNKLSLQVAFFCLGIVASGQSVGFASISELFTKQFVAVGFALNNAIILITAAVNAPLIGYLLGVSAGDGPLTLKNYLFAFNVLIVMAVLALVFSLFFVKETFCKSRVSFTVIQPKFPASNT